MLRRAALLSCLFPIALSSAACDSGSADTTSGEASAATSEDATTGTGTGTATAEATTAEATTAEATTAETTLDGTADATDSADATTTDTTDGGFVSTDMIMGCGTECDIWNPADCPTGEKCTAVACEIGSNAWDTNVCRPVDGDKNEGDDCMGAGTDGNDDCAAGLMCWDADATTGLGTCISFCIGSPTAPNCPNESQLCAQANDGTLPICLDECDPLSADCPQTDDLCIPNPGEPGFVCVLDASGGMSPYGTPCNGPNEDDNSCNQGLICIPSESVPETDCGSSPGCCSPICDLSSSDPCPGQGQMCLPFYDTPVPNYGDVGICAIPN